jgi:hypothetical protein
MEGYDYTYEESVRWENEDGYFRDDGVLFYINHETKDVGPCDPRTVRHIGTLNFNGDTIFHYPKHKFQVYDECLDSCRSYGFHIELDLECFRVEFEDKVYWCEINHVFMYELRRHYLIWKRARKNPCLFNNLMKCTIDHYDEETIVNGVLHFMYYSLEK